MKNLVCEAETCLLNFVFAPRCVLCLGGKKMICDECVRLLPKAHLKCLCCKKRNPYGIYCPLCVRKYKPDQVLSVFDYCNEVKKIIHEFKYKDYSMLSEELARQMVPAVLDLKNYSSYTLVPVPIDAKKLQYRGYNQSELLTKRLGKLTNLPVKKVLSRVHDSRPSQAQLEKVKRRKNIKGAFFVESSVKIPEKIILIDDVITTGATVEEATKTLKKAGGKSVVCISFALG